MGGTGRKHAPKRRGIQEGLDGESRVDGAVPVAVHVGLGREDQVVATGVPVAICATHGSAPWQAAVRANAAPGITVPAPSRQGLDFMMPQFLR